MNQKAKTRFMKRMVMHCMAMLTGATIASYVYAAFGVDTTPILAFVYGGFGGELLLTVVLKLVEKEDKKAEGKEGNG